MLFFEYAQAHGDEVHVEATGGSVSFVGEQLATLLVFVIIFLVFFGLAARLMRKALKRPDHQQPSKC